MQFPVRLGQRLASMLALAAIASVSAAEEGGQQCIDYLSFAQGALPVVIEGDAKALRVGMPQALLAIDGDGGGFSVTPKPGAADTRISFVYALPAATTFDGFSIPNVLETPSPSQTFFKQVEIAGSEAGPDGPFVAMGSAMLETHQEKGQATAIPVSTAAPVNWVRVTLSGGIDVQRDKTFFEFSELIGCGSQDSVPLSDAFDGKWKGRGVKLALEQDGARVTGCYDRTGELSGTVSGNMLRATGKTTDSGVPSSFVLTVGGEGGIVGVRSTNGAPFKLYQGDANAGMKSWCFQQEAPPLGCGSVLHGINFDFDSATIRPESNTLLDQLADGLNAAGDASVTVIGHTSSEGSDAYNQKLSQRRAESVVSALVERGVVAGRIGAEGRGENEPIADNATEAGRSLNRRVEIACR